MDKKDVLKEIGLTEAEIQYFSDLSDGEEIESKNSKEIYYIIFEKIANFLIEGGSEYLKSKNPEIDYKKLDEKLDKLDLILPDLKMISEKFNSDPDQNSENIQHGKLAA